MMLTLECGGCQARLKAPATSAGKRIKCPKCGVLLEIPAMDAEPEPAPAPTKQPTPRPAPNPSRSRRPAGVDGSDDDYDDRPVRKVKRRPVVEDDFDDDDYDDEDDYRPAKKKPSTKKATKRKAKAQPKSNLPLIIGLSIGLLVLVGGGVGLALFLMKDNAEAPVARLANKVSGGGSPASTASYTLDESSFQVVFNGADAPRSESAPGLPADSKIYVKDNQIEKYTQVVMALGLPPGQEALVEQNRQAAIDGGLNGMVKNMGKGQLANKSPGSIGGVSSTKFKLVDGPNQLFGHITIHRGKIYLFMTGRAGAEENDPFNAEFFNSVKFK